jgi:hypothetical protein
MSTNKEEKMEKLQLKMRMLNVAVTEDTWRVFDVIIKYSQKMGVKDETTMIGAILTTGVQGTLDDLEKIKKRDPEMLDKLKSFDCIDKGNFSENFNITI